MVFVIALCLTASNKTAFASNLLVNGDFNSPSSGTAPTGWATWKTGAGYSNHEIIPASALTDMSDGSYHNNNTGNYDGTYQETLGATASDGSGGGIYQIVGGAPNVPYTLIVDAGVQGWWLPTGQIRLIFLNGSNVGLATNTINTTDTLHSGTNGGQDLYDYGVPFQEWTNTAVSPAGTTQVKVEFAGYGGGSCWFDNAILSAPVVPPVIANLYPDGAVLQQNTNTLSFSATSAASITNISVSLNGSDISSNLLITGTPTSEAVSYTNLQPNQVYSVVISVTDNTGSSAFKNFTFDTYSPLFVWEAEDYDYRSGQFTNNPILSNTAMPGSYFGVSGTEGVDFHDYSADGPRGFRPDPMSTDVTGDVSRQNFVSAGVSDYNVGYFNGPAFAAASNYGMLGYEPQEWVNYTRTFPAGTYNLYARIANGNGGTATVPVSRVIGGQGTSAQTNSALGVFKFPAYGWGSYNYVPMVDKFGNAVVLTLSGTNTLRVSAGSGANLNFFMLMPPDTNTPTITGVYPDGSTLVQGTNKLTFTVSSPSHSIPQGNVLVTLNGITNNNLTFTGSAGSWNVTAPLAFDTTNYTAVISVTDNLGYSHSTTLYFDTFDPASYNIEAEDWDFGGGQSIDNPLITSNAAANSYFDQSGTTVDEYIGDVQPPPTADYHFRQYDYIATSLCTDTPAKDLIAAQQTNALAFNYNVAWWSTNSWLNYTHHYPSGTYNVYGRLAADVQATNMIELDKVSVSSTNYLGTFMGIGRGFNAFDWIPLINTNSGQQVTVTLSGLATLRTTSLTGNVNANSYLLVPVVQAPTPLQWSFSAGTLTLSWTNAAFHLQAQTNAPGAGIKTNWFDYPGGSSSPVYVPVNKTFGSSFFRLSN